MWHKVCLRWDYRLRSRNFLSPPGGFLILDINLASPDGGVLRTTLPVITRYSNSENWLFFKFAQIATKSGAGSALIVFTTILQKKTSKPFRHLPLLGTSQVPGNKPSPLRGGEVLIVVMPFPLGIEFGL